METTKAILERRSIRKYKAQKVAKEKLAKILQAAIFAPNAGNSQAWRFVVVKEKEKREKIAGLCEQEWMTEAPVHIVICGQTEELHDHYGERGYLYNIQSCAAAIQNMLLEAHNQGLGSCWVGHFNEEKLSKLLKVKDAHTQAVITIGYADETPEASRRPLHTAVFWESYDEAERKTDVFPLKDALERLKKNKL